MKTRRMCLAAAAVWAMGVGPAAVWAVGTPAYSVGYYVGGRLGGQGTVTDQWLPIPVVGIPDGIDLSVGNAHTMVVRADGTVWGWGSNGQGRLGNGNTTEQWLAGPVTGLTGAVAVACGYFHSLAVKTDGTVWSWGGNDQGQLGNGNTGTIQTTPVQVSGLTTAVNVAAGYHSMALLNNGAVRAWGYNNYGELGDGTTTDRNTPVQVSGLSSGVIAIAASHQGSDNHSMALKSDGTVWAWGLNGNGQLGDNSTTNRSTPVQVSGLTNAVAIAAGHYHSLAVRNNGTVWAWGQNNNGQLGDGSTTQRNTPVQVSGLTDAVSVGAGEDQSFAISADGTTWAWGNNAQGRLGDGTPVSRFTPVKVVGILASAVDSGGNHSVFLHAYDCNDPNPDCNGNGFHDGCDLLTGFSPDCNTNKVPDECDAGGATSNDCDANTVPDECDNQTGNVTWTGGNGGSYNLSSNWTPAGPPRGQSQAYFSQSGASDNRCILAGDIGTCSAVIQASGSGKQILQVNADSTYQIGNGMTINAGGELDLRGGTITGGTVTNNSNSIVAYGEISAAVLNTGLISVTAAKDLDFTGSSFDNQSTATLRVMPAARVTITGPGVSQEGAVEIRSNATLTLPTALINFGFATLYGGTLAPTGFTNGAAGVVTGFGTIDSDTTNDGFIGILADTQIVGNLVNNGTIYATTGVLTIIGSTTNNGVIIGQPGGRAPGGFTFIDHLELTVGATLQVGGGSLKLGGDFDLAIDSGARLDLTTASVQFTGSAGHDIQRLEVAAPDEGRIVTLPDTRLASVGRLRVGPVPTTLQLVDVRDNTPGDGAEALYVGELVLDAGTTLDLAGKTLYYGRVTPANPSSPTSGVYVIDSIGGGRLCAVGPVRGDGDLDGDCTATVSDVQMFVSVLTGQDADPARLIGADMNGDGRTNGADVRLFVTRIVR